jgi:hypothetical protein
MSFFLLVAGGSEGGSSAPIHLRRGLCLEVILRYVEGCETPKSAILPPESDLTYWNIYEIWNGVFDVLLEFWP